MCVCGRLLAICLTTTINNIVHLTVQKCTNHIPLFVGIPTYTSNMCSGPIITSIGFSGNICNVTNVADIFTWVGMAPNTATIPIIVLISIYVVTTTATTVTATATTSTKVTPTTATVATTAISTTTVITTRSYSLSRLITGNGGISTRQWVFVEVVISKTVVALDYPSGIT